MSQDFREILYTVDQAGRRKWVYPTIVRGAFRKRRILVSITLLAIYLSMPWLVIDGKQAVKFDFVNREFTVLGTTFIATEMLYLFLLVGIFAFALFFFTALLGRVWCGWACPQTVFLEFVFRPIEALIEGDASERKRLDAEPWSFRKLRIKATKILTFSIISWILASTLLAYFVGREELLVMIQHSPFENLTLFLVTLVLMGVILFEFGWFREQFCTILCPYARFQSVLMDRDSLAVSYDTARGEPRGKVGSTTGDCVACGLCVRVCPTGIDIRNGLQLECVQCTACIDACDSIMDKVGRPRGLIRYSTENRLEGKKSRLLRPRVLTYGAFIAVYLGLLAYLLSHRQGVEFQLVREAKDAPFSKLEENLVMNHFKIRVANKVDQPATITVSVKNNSTVVAVVPISPFPVAPHSEIDIPLFIRFPKNLLHNGKATVSLDVLNESELVGTQSVPLIGPDV